MEIKIYLHRTKKAKFAVADCFSVFIDLDKIPKDKKDDLDFINKSFANDCRAIAKIRDCIQRFGTGYISFMVPVYEGEEKDNGNNKIYFDNKQMLFAFRKPKRKKKVEGITDDRKESI